MKIARLSLCLIIATLTIIGAPLLAHAPPPDVNPPSIGTPVISPSSLSSTDIVTVRVNVTDDRSGVHNVSIVYTTNNWQGSNITALASYNATTTTATSQIPPLSSGGHIAYYVVAFDNAGNKQVNNNLGNYFTYDVSAPPFVATNSNWIILAVLAGVVAGAAVVSLKILKKGPQSTSRQSFSN